eukprot:scaffold28323_cov15-Tisochrysis_lutea.AAC.1
MPATVILCSFYVASALNVFSSTCLAMQSCSMWNVGIRICVEDPKYVMESSISAVALLTAVVPRLVPLVHADAFL